MSMAAGYLPAPAPGRYTSPTRFTPSLAGMVTSESFVGSAARAGAAPAARQHVAAAIASSASARTRCRPGLVKTIPATSPVGQERYGLGGGAFGRRGARR